MSGYVIGAGAAVAGIALGTYGIVINYSVTAGVGGLLFVAGLFAAWTEYDIRRQYPHG